MNKNIQLILLIIVITLSEALGQYLLRLGKQTNREYFAIFTWLLYGVCTYLLLKTYNYTTMGKAEVYWDALSAIIVPLIGVYAFNNYISLKGWFGILLIIIGTFLLNF